MGRWTGLGAVVAVVSSVLVIGLGSGSATAAPAPPEIVGGFDDNSLVVGQTGTLLFKITNPNTTDPLTGVNFDTNLPSALDLDTVTSTTDCDPTPEVIGSTDRFNITDATLAANTACTITINFTTTAAGTAGTSGADHIIILSDLTTNETTPTPEPDIGTLTITDPTPPAIVGGFTASPLVVGQTGTLAYTLTNSNPVPLTGVNFDTNLPSALDLDTVTSTTDCDPTPEVIGSTDRFNITDATLAANTACTITINFTTTAAGTAGTSGADHIIILSDLTTNETTPTPEPDIGTLTITDPTPPAIVGGFNASPLVVGQTGTLAYTITNSNPVPLTGVNFDTNLPGELDLDTVTSATDCDASPEVIGSTDRFNITDATLAANTACTITVNFTTTGAGTAGTTGAADHLIILSSLTTNETTPTPEPDIGTLTITDPTPPAIVGGFNASPLVVGQTGTLAYTITNSNPVPLTGVNFDTNLPSALDLDTVTSTTDCDPTPEVIGSTDRFNITDATLAANTACTITINFTTTAAGTAGTSGADHIIILSDLATNETTPTPEPDIGTLIVNDPSANVPDAPTGVMATPLDGAATVSWTAPADGGSPILGYGVQQSLNGGTTWTTVIADTGTQTTQYTVMGLTNGVPVEFRVRALNIVGTSTPSTTTGQVTPATTPNPPTGAAATPADESATVTWTAPSDDGGAAITGYRIEQSTNGGTTWTTAIANTATTATQATITGLTNGIPVEFRVSAINPLGTSTPSTTTGQVTPATTPNPPTGAAATPADESATVTWTAPADDGGAAITGYRIEQSTNGGTTWTTAIANTATTATQATITGLTNGIPVEFRVSAINPLGTSTPSTTTGQVTPATTPNPPTGAAATPADESATVTWTAPADDGGAAITGYRIEQSTNGGTTWTTAIANTATTATQATITGLTNGVPVEFRVSAINPLGTSTPSTTTGQVTPATTPNPPTGAAATPADESATVTWTAPADDGGAAITGYRIEQSTNGGTTWTTAIANTATTATQATITGLTNGIPVEFRVSAINPLGTSTPSTTTGQVTPATTPNPPTGAAATAADESATVTWTAPADDGGAAITGYRIEQSTNGGTTWTTAIANTATTATQATITGLTNGIPVEFRISAINPLGTSTPSTTTGQVTPSAPPPPDTELLVPVAPLRLADTRPSGTKVGALDGSGEPLRINVLGKAGLPTTGVGAVSLNVTAVDGEIGPIGFVTVDGCTSPRPVASNLNFITGQTVPNAVITPVSPTGEICVYVFGLAHMLIDINGWFPTGSDFGAVAPFRLADTRPTGAKVGALDGSGEPLRINVLGKAGLPTTGVGAVSLNVTAVDGEIGPIGFVTVDGCTSPRPNASNLNFITGQTVPNAVITPVSPTGEICVYVFGLAHMLIDINGWFPTGSDFGAVAPFRLADTRPTGAKVGALDGSGEPLRINVLGKAGLPTTGVGAVSLNVTAVDGEIGPIGFVTVDGCTSPRPDASNLNFITGQTVPNAVITPVSPAGEICVYVFGLAHMLIDINGWFPT